jgi:transcriptional regulator with XRE-family HTH domain
LKISKKNKDAVVTRLEPVAAVAREGFGADDLRALGRELRRLREGRGWSIKSLSDESGVSVSAIQKFESGSANPSFLTALRLTETLGRSLNEIVEGARRSRDSELFIKKTLQRNSSGIVSLSSSQEHSVLGSSFLVLRPGEELSGLNISAPHFTYVIEGSVVVTLSNGAKERLQNSDAMHVADAKINSVENAMGRRAVVLCIADGREKHDIERDRA